MGNAYSFTKTISKPIAQIAEKKALCTHPAKKSCPNHSVIKHLHYSKDKHELHNKVKSPTK